MKKQLLQEALDLHSRIYHAFLIEENRRDDQFRRISPDSVKVERLQRLSQKTADRWRRRGGFAPLYSVSQVRRSE